MNARNTNPTTNFPAMEWTSMTCLRALFLFALTLPLFAQTSEIEPKLTAAQFADLQSFYSTHPCADCDGSELVITQPTVIDLSGNAPQVTGQQDIAALLTMEKEGNDPANWNAVVTLGGRALRLTWGASLTVKAETYQNGTAVPGLRIVSNCNVTVEVGASLGVLSQSARSGDLDIRTKGDLFIAGHVYNRNTGTWGRTGNLSLTVGCGTLTLAPQAKVELQGSQEGGGDVRILAFGEGGNLELKGLVDAHFAYNRSPNIHVASFAGHIRIDGTRLLGVEEWTNRRIATGITLRSEANSPAGDICIVARDQVEVIGYGHQNYSDQDSVTFTLDAPMRPDGAVVPVTVTLTNQANGQVGVNLSIPQGSAILRGFFGNLNDTSDIGDHNASGDDLNDHRFFIADGAHGLPGFWMSPPGSWDFALGLGDSEKPTPMHQASFTISGPNLRWQDFMSGQTEGWMLGVIMSPSLLGKRNDSQIRMGMLVPNFIPQHQFGTVAIKTKINGKGGELCVQSLQDNVYARDWAFDPANHDNRDGGAIIEAHGDVELKATYDGTATGDGGPILIRNGGTQDIAYGGTTVVRSYTGWVRVIDNAMLDARGNTSGSNDLIACLGVQDNGRLLPADANPSNDSGTCPRTLEIAILAPEEGALLNQRPVAFNGTYGPLGSEVTLEGGPVINTSTGTWNTTRDLPDGTHTLTAVVSDNGETAQDQVTFTVDTTPPVINLTAPDSVVPGQSLSFSWTITDLSPTQAAILLNGQQIGSDLTGNFTLQVPNDANTPPYTITLQALDAAGNAAPEYNHQVAIDVPTLSVAITAPTAGTYTNQDQIEVSGTVSPAGTAVQVNSIEAQVTGIDWTVNLPLNTEGSIEITAEAQAFGQTESDTRSIIRDVTPPTLTLTAPEQIDAGDTFTYNWLAEDETELASTSLTRDGQAISDQASGTEDLTPADGVTQVDFALSATDRAGNQAQTQATTLVVMLGELTVAITSPEAGSYTNADTITVIGSVSDETATVTLNGIDAAVTGNTWQLDLPLDSEGTITLSAVATRGGDQATATRDIIRDVTPPTLTLTAPEQIDAGDTFTYTWLAEDDTELASTSLTRDGQAISDQASGSEDLTPADGVTQVDFALSATDRAGNQAQTQATTLVIVLGELTVAITTPAAGSYTNADTITVTGSVSDENATVTLNGIDATVTGNTWQLDLPLNSEGTITLTAVATRGSDQASATRDIIRDVTPPTLTLTVPEQVNTSETFDYSWLAEDETELVTSLVTLDGSQISDQAQGQDSTTAPDQATQLVFALQALDRAGNSANAEQTVNVVPIPLEVTITEPQDGSSTSAAAITVMGTVSPAEASVSVNGIAADNQNGTWSVEVPLETEGSITLTATATLNNQSASASVTIQRDLTPPVVTIDAPSFFLRGESHPLVVRVESDSSVQQVRLTAGPITFEPSANNPASFILEVPADEVAETYTLTAEADNALGLTGTTTISVPVRNLADLDQVVITLTSPEHKANLAEIQQTITGNVTPVDAQVTLAGQPVSVDSNGAFQWTDDLHSGINTYLFRGTREGYLPGTAKLDLFLDNFDPVVVIETPENGLRTNQATITIGGTVTDQFDQTPTLTRNDETVTLEEGRFLHRNVALSEGENTFVYTATDNLGNQGNATLTVYYRPDTQGPSISLEHPNAIQVGSDYQVSISAEPLEDITALELYVDHNLIHNADTGDAHTASLRQNGAAQSIPVMAIARDRYGNQSEASGEILVARPHFIEGQVLDDTTSYPLAGISISVRTPLQTQTLTSAADGSYDATIYGYPLEVIVDSTTYATVARHMPQAQDHWRVPDLRLTQRNSVASGPSIEAGNQSLSFNGSLAMTPQSQQAIAELLPLGISPVASFEATQVSATGLATWRATQLPQALTSAQLLLLKREDMAWRVLSQPQASGREFAISINDLTDGAYMLARVDQWAIQNPTEVGALLLRQNDPIVPPNTISRASTNPERASIFDNPQTTYTTTISTQGELRSGVRARVIVNEVHERYNETLTKPAFPLDFFAYSYTFGDHATATRLGAYLGVRARRELLPDITRRAEIMFDTLSGDVNLAQYPEQPILTLGNLTLNMNGTDSVPHPVHAAIEANQADVPLPTGATWLFGFNWQVGGTLARAPQLTFQAPSSNAMLLLQRDPATDFWYFVETLTHDGQAWRNQPDTAHLLSSGSFALVAVTWDTTSVSGIVRNGSTPVANAYVHARQLPWRAITQSDGSYQLVVPQTSQALTLQADAPHISRSGSLALPITQGSANLDNQDITLTPRNFMVRFGSPADGSRHLDLLPEFRVEFNRPVTADADILNASIQLASQSGTQIGMQMVAETGREALSLIPNTALLPGTDYSLTLNTNLESLDGDVLSQSFTVNFTTRVESVPVDLDLSQFYLQSDQGTLYLAAPSSAFPSGTQLQVRNPNNGFGLTFTLGSSDIRREIVASVGDPIELIATDPTGGQHFRTIGLTEVAPNTYRLGAHPFSLRLSDNLVLRVDDIQGDFGAEVRIEAVEANEIEAFDSNIAALEDMPELAVLQSFRMERTDGGALPRMDFRMQLEALPPTLLNGNVFSMTYTPNIMAPADPTQPDVLSPQTLVDFDDIVVIEDGQPAQGAKRRSGKRFLAGTMIMGSFDGVGSMVAQSIRTNEVPLNPNEYPIRANVRCVRQHSSWQPPIERPATSSAAWHSETPGGYYPVPGVPVYRVFYVGERPVFRFMGISDRTGQAQLDYFGQPPTNYGLSLRGLDPVTGQIGTIGLVSSGLILNDNPLTMGFSLGSVWNVWVQFQPDQYTVDLGNPPPVPTLGVRWDVLRLNEDEAWVLDQDATDRLRSTRRIQSNTFNQLRLTVQSSQPIANDPAPAISLRGGISPEDDYVIDGQSLIYTFPAGVFAQGGTLTATVTINTTLGSSNTISDSFMILSDSPQPSIAGPPYVLFTNPEDETTGVLVDVPIAVAFSEPVQQINSSTVRLMDLGEGEITEPGSGTTVDMRILDQNGDPIEDAEHRASVIYLVPQQALSFNHTYQIQVQNVRDAEDLAPVEVFNALFTTLPFENTDQESINYFTTVRAVRNLTVVLSKNMGELGKLDIYDTRNGRQPMQQVTSRIIEWPLLPPSWDFPTFEIFLPNDFDQGTNQVNDSVPLDDLPSGTIFAVIAQRFPENVSYVNLWRYTGGGNFEEILEYPNVEIGLAYASAKFKQFLFLGYKLFDYTNANLDTRARTVVIDLKTVMEELEPLKARYTSREINRVEYEQLLIDLGTVATYPTPGNITDITVFQRKEVEDDITYVKPAFLLSAQDRPAIFDLDLDNQPPFPGGPMPSGDPDFDDRLVVRTNYPAGQTFMRHDNGAVTNFVYRDFVDGFREVDLAVFMSRYPQGGGSHIQVFEIPRRGDMNRTMISPIRQLNFSSDLYSIAVDPETGLIAVQAMNGDFSLLDLRVLMESQNAAEGFAHPAFMFEPMQQPLQLLTFAEGNLYGLDRGGRQLYRWPVAPRQYRALGWEYLDLADWNQPVEEGGSDNFGTVSKFTQHMVFYATDLTVNNQRKFVMEQGSFAIELFDSADINLEIKNGLTNAVVAEVSRSAEDISGAGVQSFSFKGMREHFADPNTQAALRREGVLPFELKYVVEKDGTIELEDQIKFLVAYRYPETRYTDPYRDLNGIDALAATPALFSFDHTLSSVDHRLDLSPSRAYSFDYALQTGPFGPGMLNGWLLHMGLPVWWDIASLPASGNHDATHAHPRLLLEQPGRFGVEFEIAEDQQKAIAKNDLVSEMTLQEGRWRLLHRKEMAYNFETGRNLPDYNQIFVGLNGEQDDQDKLRFPVLRFSAPTADLPTRMLGETTLRDMRDMRWDNRLKFRDDQNRSSAMPAKVEENINDLGGQRTALITYEDQTSGRQITELKLSDGMTLTYVYDAEGYLQEMRRNNQRPVTFTWEALDDAYKLGNFTPKVLTSVAAGSGADRETTSFAYQNFNVASMTTPFGSKTLTLTRDQTGMVSEASISGIAPAPGQGVTFALSANQWLSSQRRLGQSNYNHTWELKVNDDQKQNWLVSTDTAFNQSFDYDDLGRLTRHERNQGSQSWAFGNSQSGFEMYATSFTDPENNQFSITTSNTQMKITSGDTSIGVKFSGSGAKIAEENALGLVLGAPNSRFYIPSGNGFEVENGRQSRVPYPNQEVPMLGYGYGGIGSDLVFYFNNGVDTVYDQFDTLGRPRRLFMFGDEVVYDIARAFESGLQVETTTDTVSGAATEESYDERGLLIRSRNTIDDEERIINYEYDDLGRLERVTTSPTNEVVYSATFDDDSDLPLRINENGQSITFQKGPGFFPTVTGATLTEGGLSRAITIKTNQNGKVTETEVEDIGVQSFIYDAFGRVTTEQTVDANKRMMPITTYEYGTGSVTANYLAKEATKRINFLDSTGLNRNITISGNGLDNPVNRTITTNVSQASGKGYVFEEAMVGGAVPQRSKYNSQGDTLGGSFGRYQFEADTSDLGRFGEPKTFSGALSMTLESDALGRYTQTTDYHGNQQTRDYDILNRPTGGTDERDKPFSMSYFGDSDDLSQIDVTAMDADGDGQVSLLNANDRNSSSSQGWLGGEEQRNMTALDETYTLTRDGQTATAEYDPASGRLERMVNFSGEESTFEWIVPERRLRIDTPGEAPRYVDYDFFGEVRTITQSGRTLVHIERDSDGRIVSIERPTGTIELEYDGEDLVGLNTPGLPVTLSDFNEQGRPANMRIGNLGSFEMDYQQGGIPGEIRVRSQGGKAATLRANRFGDVTYLQSGNTPALQFSYNEWGAPATMQMGNGPVNDLFTGDEPRTLNLPGGIVIELDEYGKVVAYSVPGIATRNYSYDPNGRIGAVSSNGQRLRGYERFNGLMDTIRVGDTGNLCGDNQISFAYDALGRVEQITSQADGITRNNYDDDSQFLYRPESITDGNDVTRSFSYNTRGQQTSIAIQDGPTFNYGWDENDNLTSIQVDDLATTFSNYNDGYPGNFEWRRADNTVQRFDVTSTNNQITNISGGAYAVELQWQNELEVAQMVRRGPGLQETITTVYSEGMLAGIRLTRVQGSDPASPDCSDCTTTVIDETYDPTSQMLKGAMTRSINGQVVIDQDLPSDQGAAGNRLSSINQIEQQGVVGYDDLGNIVDLSYPWNAVNVSLNYDCTRKVRSISSQGDLLTRTSEYRYDINNRRISSTAGGQLGNIVYVYDDSRVIAIGIKEINQVTWTHAFGYGPLGPTFIKDLTGNGRDYFILTDHLGTPFAYRDAASGETFFTPHNPWGELLADQGDFTPDYARGSETAGLTVNLPPDAIFPHTPLGLSGHVYDYDTGLTYMHHRFYHPRLGHFSTHDFRAPSLLDPTSFNQPYAYANGNPMAYWDPDGQVPILIPLLLKAGAAGGADFMMQVTFAYLFDPNVETIEQAIDQVNWIDVARATGEGLIPWRVPGGILGEAAIDATSQVLDEYMKSESEYSSDQAIQTFAFSFLVSLGGGGVAKLIDRYGAEAIARGMQKIGINPRRNKALADMLPPPKPKKPSAAGLEGDMARDRFKMCFVAGTMIATLQGAVAIETIKPGDWVLSAHESTGELSYQPVLEVFETEPEQLYHISYSSEDSVVKELQTTAEHPFFVTDSQSWVPAAELSIGQSLWIATGKKAQVLGIHIERGPPGSHYATYNFAVANTHTYFAAPIGSDSDTILDDAVWVHNTGPKECKRNPQDPNVTSSPKGNESPNQNHIEATRPRTTALEPSVKAKEASLADDVPGNDGFADWFDKLDPDEFDKYWADAAAQKVIKRRLRHPGGFHEWFMVSRTPKLKRLGLTAQDLFSFRTRTTSLRWYNPHTGRFGKHGGHGSTTFHNELGRIIDHSSNINELYSGLVGLSLKWSIPNLPTVIRR